jgi:hypothetical protein
MSNVIQIVQELEQNKLELEMENRRLHKEQYDLVGQLEEARRICAYLEKLISQRDAPVKDELKIANHANKILRDNVTKQEQRHYEEANEIQQLKDELEICEKDHYIELEHVRKDKNDALRRQQKVIDRLAEERKLVKEYLVKLGANPDACAIDQAEWVVAHRGWNAHSIHEPHLRNQIQDLKTRYEGMSANNASKDQQITYLKSQLSKADDIITKMEHDWMQPYWIKTPDGASIKTEAAIAAFQQLPGLRIALESANKVVNSYFPDRTAMLLHDKVVLLGQEFEHAQDQLSRIATVIYRPLEIQKILGESL